MYFVYILQSIKNQRFYIGSSHDVQKRLQYHNNGLVKSTKNMRPWQLMLSQPYDTLHKAKCIEYRIKKLKRRDYIQKMIDDNTIGMQ